MKRYYKVFSVLMLLVLAASFAWAALHREQHETIGTNESYTFDASENYNKLAYLRPNVFSALQSSYDRAGGNNDGWDQSNFLYTDDHHDQVMLDVKGPGKVNRLWFAGAWDIDQTYFQFYFDGESSPRLKIKMRDMFNGSTPPFLEHLTGDGSVSSGGNFCYVTIPFAKGLKITATPVGKDFFYQVGYDTFSPGTSIASWPEHDINQSYDDLVKKTGSTPYESKGNVAEKTVNLSGGATIRLADLRGPATIQSIKLNIPEVIEERKASADVLNKLWLRIRYDGEKNPSFYAPLGSVFAMGQFGIQNVRSLPAGINENGDLYLYLPAPFKRSAQIDLVSFREMETKAVKFTTEYTPFTDSMDKVGYLHAAFTDLHPKSGDGSDYTVLDSQGIGHVVGIIQSFAGDTDRRYLEGDERIYIDGSRSPVWMGTGTEDLYNGGGYFINGTFTLPFHGNGAHKEGEQDLTAAYRFFINDPIPFRNGITFGLEHGADLNGNNPSETTTNDANVEVSSLVYYYNANMETKLTDSLDIGNSSSEQSHAYQLTDQTSQDTRSGTYEGSEEDRVVTLPGRSYTGSSELTLKVDPHNHGVILRRTFDQTMPNSEATVSIDGVPVGTWYHAGSNVYHLWRDDDFMIPMAYTANKKELHVKIVNVAKNTSWSEYGYKAYSLDLPKVGILQSLLARLHPAHTPEADPQGPASKAAAPKHFANEVKPPLWSWVREDSSKYKLFPDTGIVRIIGQQGELFYDSNNAKNILLRNAPEQDFSIVSKLTFPSPLDSNYQQAGVIIYQDDDNYVKIGRMSSDGISHFVFTKEVGKTTEDQSVPDNVASQTLYLRLTKLGHQYSAYYSTNGIHFTRAGTFFSASLNAPRVGVFAWTNAGKEMAADFESFQIIDHH
ncbi:DUF2961 domain-containing protein [Paenibacillus pectinilyticus]|uniref:DUF2961 domain-containing protein n=1 Tax=Paenibacillus pectinilyticus TaxID=512399 RepID=UPI001428B2E9|nr:DUF2961 domain-containing protein [Paenibacillus pectinilyticus]